MFIIVNWVFTLTSHHLPISFFLNASIIDRVLVMFQYNIIAILWWRYVECIDIFNFGYGPATCWIVLVLLSLFFLSYTDLDLFLLINATFVYLFKKLGLSCAFMIRAVKENVHCCFNTVTTVISRVYEILKNAFKVDFSWFL